MKISKRKLIISVASIVILLASLGITLADYLVPLNFWTHPALTFFFCAFIGFGVMVMIMGFTRNSPWYFFLSAILLGLALIYAMLQYLAWWIGVIIVAVVWIIFAILSFISAGNKTEEISVNRNDGQNEGETTEEKQTSETKEEELPKLKSFKDDN